MTPLQPATVHRPRTVERIVHGQPTSDGAGVKLLRLLTHDLQQRLDPFLMLDNFASDDPDDYIAGFPDHPHRGFETVTYMITGRMRHRDSAGHEGLLQNGGVQWMTAGRGLVHSELPEQEEAAMEGFQLWLNLPAKDKMCTPWYRDIQSGDIPGFTLAADAAHHGDRPGVQVRVIAGSSHGVRGAVQRDGTAPLYLDITLPPGARFSQPLPDGHNAFVVVYRESVNVGDTAVAHRKMAILRNDAGSDGITLSAPATLAAPARVLLIAGQPLHEPIAQYGPFVMNTREQLMQAVDDFQNGRLV